jgi:hypothetical protein
MLLKELKTRNVSLTYDGDSLIIPLFTNDIPNKYKETAYNKLVGEIAKNHVEIALTDELEGEIVVDLADKKCELALCVADTVKNDYKAEMHIPIKPTKEFRELVSDCFNEYIFDKTA